MIKRLLLGTITFILLGLLIYGIGYFLITPNKTNIVLFRESLNVSKISRNTSLKLFTTISLPVSEFEASQESDTTAVEAITPESLLQYQNEGNVIEYLEPYNTRLEIPSASISGKVFDGTDSSTMLEGFWHFPLTPGVGKKGNFVVIAHRYDKLPPETDTFFNLDLVQIGDTINVTQDNDNWKYTVTNVKIVEKNDRSILMQTSDYRITLVTCTPLWTSDQRLVVIGKLDKIYENI